MSTEDDKKHDESVKGRIREPAKKSVRHFRDLDVYQNALATGLRVYELTKRFPGEEKYSLTDQAAFVSKPSDAESEAAETQVHIEFAMRHSYVSEVEFREIDSAYERILGQLVKMIEQPEKWLIRQPPR